LEHLPKPLPVLDVDWIVETVESAQSLIVLRSKVGNIFQHAVEGIPGHEIEEEIDQGGDEEEERDHLYDPSGQILKHRGILLL
jgi:hypothetical protein